MIYLFSCNERKQNGKKCAGGFTLVEMIVGVFLFTIVMLVAVGALMSVLDANRRAQANKAVMNNLHFALESMTREIRVGREYRTDSVETFLFTDKDGCRITYALADVNGDGNKEVVRSVSDTTTSCEKGNSDNVPMTAPEVTVSSLQFYVGGTDPGPADTTQPHVIIIVRGSAGLTERTRVPFNLQTFVTQRFLDR